MNKKAQLLELAKKRQNTRWANYKNIGDYHQGAYECDWVSPYTKSADNVNASIMVFLQDWASDHFLRGETQPEVIRLGYSPNLPTNRNLIRFLDQHFGTTLKETYATNLFPFIKLDAMSAGIPTRDMLRAAREFGIPQMEIINPKIAICLGVSTFNALRVACGVARVKTMKEGIESSFSYSKTRIFCQAHTGMLGQNNRNRGGTDRVFQDWATMADYYKSAQQHS